jgi:predicted alpha/beta hydrolase family esterase
MDIRAHRTARARRVAHSLGSLMGLHLRRELGARVTRMTLIEPVLVSVLRERGEDAAYAEMARRALGPTAQVYDSD